MDTCVAGALFLVVYGRRTHGQGEIRFVRLPFDNLFQNKPNLGLLSYRPSISVNNSAPQARGCCPQNNWRDKSNLCRRYGH